MDQLRLITGVTDELQDYRGVTSSCPKLTGEHLRLSARGTRTHVHLGQLAAHKAAACAHCLTIVTTNAEPGRPGHLSRWRRSTAAFCHLPGRFWKSPSCNHEWQQRYRRK